MGVLTPCNLCSLNAMKRRAKKRGQVVKLVNAPMCGSEKAVKAYYCDSGEEPTGPDGWAGWFMEIPKKCEC